MQLFHGTLTIKSRPVDDGTATTCQAVVNTPYEKEVPTPVTIKAYGKAGGRLENCAPGCRIQVVNGSLHRGSDYSYVIKPYRFMILTPDSLEMIPDWHGVVLAGRTTNELNTNDSRMVVARPDFLSVTRSIAVNRSRNEADFFEVQAISNSNDKVNRAQQLMDYFCTKGAFMMVDGHLASRQGTAKDGSVRVYTKVMVDRVYFGPRTSINPPVTTPNTVVAGGQFMHAEPAQVLDPQAQPAVIDPDELPF